jgi:hypothetical protein
MAYIIVPIGISRKSADRGRLDAGDFRELTHTHEAFAGGHHCTEN